MPGTSNNVRPRSADHASSTDSSHTRVASLPRSSTYSAEMAPLYSPKRVMLFLAPCLAFISLSLASLILLATIFANVKPDVCWLLSTAVVMQVLIAGSMGWLGWRAIRSRAMRSRVSDSALTSWTLQSPIEDDTVVSCITVLGNCVTLATITWVFISFRLLGNMVDSSGIWTAYILVGFWVLAIVLEMHLFWVISYGKRCQRMSRAQYECWPVTGHLSWQGDDLVGTRTVSSSPTWTWDPCSMDADTSCKHAFWTRHSSTADRQLKAYQPWEIFFGVRINSATSTAQQGVLAPGPGGDETSYLPIRTQSNEVNGFKHRDTSIKRLATCVKSGNRRKDHEELPPLSHMWPDSTTPGSLQDHTDLEKTCGMLLESCMRADGPKPRSVRIPNEHRMDKRLIIPASPRLTHLSGCSKLHSLDIEHQQSQQQNSAMPSSTSTQSPTKSPQSPSENEALTHPLFRTNSPSPLPSTSPSTVIKLSRAGGLDRPLSAIGQSRQRLGSANSVETRMTMARNGASPPSDGCCLSPLSSSASASQSPRVRSSLSPLNPRSRAGSIERYAVNASSPSLLGRKQSPPSTSIEYRALAVCHQSLTSTGSVPQISGHYVAPPHLNYGHGQMHPPEPVGGTAQHQVRKAPLCGWQDENGQSEGRRSDFEQPSSQLVAEQPSSCAPPPQGTETRASTPVPIKMVIANTAPGRAQIDPARTRMRRSLNPSARSSNQPSIPRGARSPHSLQSLDFGFPSPPPSPVVTVSSRGRVVTREELRRLGQQIILDEKRNRQAAGEDGGESNEYDTQDDDDGDDDDGDDDDYIAGIGSGTDNGGHEGRAKNGRETI